MKSSRRGTSPKYFVGLAVSLVFLFTVFNQAGYKMRVVDGETVLGTSDDGMFLTRTLNDSDQFVYACNRTNCDSKKSKSNCVAMKDYANRPICYWTNPSVFGTAQCDVSKSNYRSNSTSFGSLNMSLGKAYGESLENVAYYNCKKIPIATPTSRLTPTKKAPTPPKKAPTPTPKKAKYLKLSR